MQYIYRGMAQRNEVACPASAAVIPSPLRTRAHSLASCGCIARITRWHRRCLLCCSNGTRLSLQQLERAVSSGARPPLNPKPSLFGAASAPNAFKAVISQFFLSRFCAAPCRPGPPCWIYPACRRNRCAAVQLQECNCDRCRVNCKCNAIAMCKSAGRERAALQRPPT